jgi:hypothetical protein
MTTYVQLNTTTFGSNSTFNISLNSTTVNKGDLLVLFLAAGSNTFVSSNPVTDGTNTWITETPTSVNGNVILMAWTISQISSSSLTVTVSWNNVAAGNLSIIEYTPSSNPFFYSVNYNTVSAVGSYNVGNFISNKLVIAYTDVPSGSSATSPTLSATSGFTSRFSNTSLMMGDILVTTGGDVLSANGSGTGALEAGAITFSFANGINRARPVPFGL